MLGSGVSYSTPVANWKWRQAAKCPNFDVLWRGYNYKSLHSALTVIKQGLPIVEFLHTKRRPDTSPHAQIHMHRSYSQLLNFPFWKKKGKHVNLVDMKKYGNVAFLNILIPVSFYDNTFNPF